MSYLAYNYTSTDTYAGIAKAFNVSVSDIMKVNNIRFPYPQRPSQVGAETGTILIPDIATGNVSVESGVNQYRDVVPTTNVPTGTVLNIDRSGINSQVGWNSQAQCYLIIDGLNQLDGPNHDRVYFPCFPESVSDSNSSNFSEMHPIGRSEPFQIYQNSGPREVGVSFTMHKEMCHITPIEKIVHAVTAATYPLGRRMAATSINSPSVDGIDIVPRVTLVIGREITITGIIKGSVSVKWYGPINAYNRYNMADLDFTVTECTGNPKTAENIANWDGIYSMTEDYVRNANWEQAINL